MIRQSWELSASRPTIAVPGHRAAPKNSLVVAACKTGSDHGRGLERASHLLGSGDEYGCSACRRAWKARRPRHARVLHQHCLPIVAKEAAFELAAPRWLRR